MSVIKLPKANTGFQSLTDANLATKSQAIHDGLAASVGTFPTPPITLTILQSGINAYNAALALAIGPGAGVENTRLKNQQKLRLQGYLRANAFYVNQIIVDLARSGTAYEDLQVLVLGTGYELSRDPAPAGPLPAPEIVKYFSPKTEQFYILLRKVPNAKGYEVNIKDNTTGEFLPNQSFPSTRITILGLTKGHEYRFEIASIGASPVRNFSDPITGIVI